MTLNSISLTEFSCDPKQLSPLTLAFIGDTVYDLFVREMVISSANRPANQLHTLSAQRVRASAQAQAARALLDKGFLHTQETAVLRRGRNAHSRHQPKNMSEADYHLATGLEALFGYLYLSRDVARLRQIFREICAEFDDDPGESNE